MGPDSAGEPRVRELRLEGLRLAAVAVVVVAALVGSFQLGRWIERGTLGGAPAAEKDPLRHVAGDDPSAAGHLSFFDTLTGGGKVPEPDREVRSSPQPPPPPIPDAGADRAPVPRGRYFVQVSALRDRAAAERVARELRGRGYTVQLFPDRDRGGEVMRVRVGSYATREEARAAAQKLGREGHPGAWVSGTD